MEPDHTQERFEEVYPRYEFAALVQIALYLAAWIKRITSIKVRPLREESAHDPTGPGHVPSR